MPRGLRCRAMGGTPRTQHPAMPGRIRLYSTSTSERFRRCPSFWWIWKRSRAGRSGAGFGDRAGRLLALADHFEHLGVLVDHPKAPLVVYGAVGVEIGFEDRKSDV